MTSLLLRLAALALVPAAFAQPVPAQAGTGQLGVVPVRPQPPAEQEDWVATRSSSSGCIDVARIGGAVVIDSRNLDVVMRGGQRFRLTLAQSCPQLSYYGGFYYKPTQPGKFCAGRDRVMAREGGACRVSRISELKKAKPSRR